MIFQEGLAAVAESEELEVAPQAGVTAKWKQAENAAGWRENNARE